MKLEIEIKESTYKYIKDIQYLCGLRSAKGVHLDLITAIQNGKIIEGEKENERETEM